MSLLCHYPIRAIICKNFPNQSTSEASLLPRPLFTHSRRIEVWARDYSEACNAPWLQSKLLQISCSMASLVPYVRYGHSCHRKPSGLRPSGFLCQLCRRPEGFLWQLCPYLTYGTRRPCHNYYLLQRQITLT